MFGSEVDQLFDAAHRNKLRSLLRQRILPNFQRTVQKIVCSKTTKTEIIDTLFRFTSIPRQTAVRETQLLLIAADNMLENPKSFAAPVSARLPHKSSQTS